MKVGIKTYSDKLGYDYLPKIIEYADFVEILPLPDNDFYRKFKQYDIPFRVHAPHQGQGADPADKNAAERTMKCMKTAIEAADFFDSPTIVVHPGTYTGAGSADRAIEFLKQFNDKRFLIENLPAECCGKGELGHLAEHIQPFLDRLKCGMCFDFGHAVLTEHAKAIGYKKIIEDFLKLKPKYFHMTGGSLKECIDHKELFYGDFDIEFFRRCIPRNSVVVLETPQDAEMQKKEIRFVKEGIAP